jgi:4-hydroxy-3-polyprenylbenzoate decarboxylase
VPVGSDELGIAGALQDSPIGIVPAKTVDAYSIAHSEWVIEGYVDTTERTWETDEAEEIGKPGIAPTMPEWAGYMGKAIRPFKFQATAITRRKDRPIFYTPLADSFESDFLSSVFREACFFELAERLIPGLVIDVNTLPGTHSNTSIIYQVKKRRGSDDAYLRNILSAAIISSPGLQLAIGVDEDIDIYSANDVWWAVGTRVNAETDIVKAVGGLGVGFYPTKSSSDRREISHGGGLIIDATAPFALKQGFERAKYPVDRIDLRKWFSEADIAAIEEAQSEYARLKAKMGW